MGFGELVDRCAAELHEATAHPGAPLEKLVETLGVGRDTSRAPLVQVLFNVLNFAPPRLALTGLTGEVVPVPKPGSPFDVTVYVVQRDGRCGVDVVYNPDLFDADRIDALLADLADLVGALAADPHTPADTVAVALPRPTVRVAALGAMTVAATAPAPVAPVPTGPDELTETEELIAGIWREVAGTRPGRGRRQLLRHRRALAGPGRGARPAHRRDRPVDHHARPVPAPHRPGARRQPRRGRRPTRAGPRRAARRRPARPDPPYPTASPTAPTVTPLSSPPPPGGTARQRTTPMQNEIDTAPPIDDGIEPIAIVGLAARLPGAADVGEFWRNLVDGVESVTELSRDEQLARGATADELDDPGWVSRAPLIDGYDTFDAGLFGMTAARRR